MSSPSPSSAPASDLAESIVSSALSLARKWKSKSCERQTYYYPNDEIEWLATVAFNRAVDFFVEPAESVCRRWAAKAILLADTTHVEGPGHGATQLGRILRDSLAKLGISY